MADVLFLRLRMASTGNPVLVNDSNIRAVYSSGKDTAVIDYSGTDAGCVEVLESVESIEKILRQILQQMR